MKNLFDPVVKAAILSRIDKLSPDAKTQWGKMNVNQGLRHMAMALDIPTGKLDPTLAKPIPFPKWLLRLFLLNMKPPKAKAETFKEINLVANNISPTDFEEERKNLKKAVEDFYNTSSLIPQNKFAGKFSKTDWGKLN